MIFIKKPLFICIILLLLLGYKGYISYQDKNIEKERERLTLLFNEGIESPTSSFNDDNHIIIPNISNKPVKSNLKRIEDNSVVIDDKFNMTKKTENETYKIIGKIMIDKIDYSGVIIDGATEENLKIGICKVAGNDINKIGNLVLAGHNMKDGSLFSNLELLEIGDIFKISDTEGTTKTYKIYRKKIVSAYDLSPLYQTKDEIKATLFTCTEQGKKRLVLYSIEDTV